MRLVNAYITITACAVLKRNILLTYFLYGKKFLLRTEIFMFVIRIFIWEDTDITRINYGYLAEAEDNKGMYKTSYLTFTFEYGTIFIHFVISSYRKTFKS